MKYAAGRLEVVRPSASAAVSLTAQGLKAAGHDVIDLGLGEPDFETPVHIVMAAHEAALSGKTKYPPTQGEQALRAAVQAKLKRDNALDYALDEIIVSNGAKQVIFDALMATLEPSQEVLLCAPFFDSYKNIVLVLGGVPVIVPCSEDAGFKLTAELLEEAITDETRWIILNSPSNPSGATYSVGELRAIGEVLTRHPQVLVLSDEIYEHIVFDGGEARSFVAACPALAERVLTVNGVSKAYAMTGWRIGYGAGPKGLISAMIKVQSQISSGACSIAQAAAVAALNGPQDCVREFREAFEDRRNLVVRKVASIDGLSLASPGGAFYALIGCRPYIGSVSPEGAVIEDDVAFVEYLLNEMKVACVPGSTYGVSPFFRISTASSEAVLGEALDRIADGVSRLSVNNQ